MSDQTEDKPWFAPKHFGYGAGFPISWQGWAVVAGFLAGVGFVAWFGQSYLQDSARTIFSIGGTAVLVLVLVLIANAKTKGGWHWRWGDDD